MTSTRARRSSWWTSRTTSTDPAGNLYVAGGDSIVATVNPLITAARDRGTPVVYTQDWHPEVTAHFDTHGGPWPVHCVAGTWGAQFHPALDVAGPIVRKGTGGEHGYSGSRPAT